MAEFGSVAMDGDFEEDGLMKRVTHFVCIVMSSIQWAMANCPLRNSMC